VPAHNATVAAFSTGGIATPPPTPPPPSPLPHFPSFPLPSIGTAGGMVAAARLPPTRSMPPRSSLGTPQPSLGRRGPMAQFRAADAEYHDMVLPCGLFQDEVIELMYRDLSPEDFETLCKLDERLPKKNTAQRNLVDRLPRAIARDCGATECMVCLAEFEPTSHVVKLPCRHAFHRACISKWLTQCKSTCPLCFLPIQLQGAATPSAVGNSATTRAV
jgi:hypothetical protein